MTNPNQPDPNQPSPNQPSPNQPSPNQHDQYQPGQSQRFIGAPQPYRENMPAELSGGSEVKKRGWNPWRAFVAVLIALAMVLAGVIVSVAVLRGPQVKADAPLDPATPAVQGGGSTPRPAEPGEMASLEGTTFTVPVQEAHGETFTIEVTGAGRYDPWEGDGIHGYYPWLTDGYLQTVVEGTLTSNATDRIDLTEEFQAFVRTENGEYVRAETVLLNQDSYGYPRVEPGESVDVTIIFPTEEDHEPEAVGLALGSGWYDSATWLDLAGVPEVDYTGTVE